MAVGTVSAVNDATVSTTVSTTMSSDMFASINLGDMIATRISGAAGSAAGLASIIGARQPASIMRTAAAGGTPARVGSTGSLDVPDNIRAYGNGKIPREMLSPIGIGQHRMVSAGADAFASMRAAAAQAGVTIGVTDSYRSYDQQVDLAQRKGLYKNGGLAAVPGTSPHGWGLALDVDVNPSGLAWLRQNAATYGFEETTPREPWHWEYRGPT